MGFLFISYDALNVNSVINSVADTACGANVTFTGTVRSQSRGEAVQYLEYDAYKPMAEKELNRIITIAEERWDAHCAIAHRLGRVEVGECSVVICVATPHRQNAFEACEWLMETLKAEIPIWKKEFFAAGVRWIEGADAKQVG